MKKLITILLLLIAFCSFGQDQKPTDASQFKYLQTPFFYRNLTDSTLWVFTGPYGWTQLLNKRDSVKRKDYATQFDLLTFLMKKDTLGNKGYVSRYGAVALIRSSISLTTLGTSDSATYSPITGVFNIPKYSGGGTISGTVNFLPKFTGIRAIGNSIIKITGSDTTTFSTYKGLNSSGNNLFIGGGGQKSLGEPGYNYKGSNNTSTGPYSLYNITKGYSNTADGFGALMSCTEGSSNTAGGLQALGYLTFGWNTTALGALAGMYYGSSLGNNTSPANGLFLGYNTRASANGNIDEIVVGANAVGHGSYTATWGNSTILDHFFSGDITTPDTIHAKAFIKAGGSPYQYLMADGSTSLGSTGIDTTIVLIKPTAQSMYQPKGNYEHAYGNPVDSNYVLTSTPSGIRSWVPNTSGSMVFPGSAGIPIFNGTAWGSSLTDNHLNWDKFNQWDGASAGLNPANGRSSLGISYAVQNLVGTTVSWDISQGSCAKITLNGNTSIVLANLSAGQSGNISVYNSSTAYTLSFSGYSNKLNPVIYYSANTVRTSGGGKTDVFSWWFDGTYLFWNGSLNYQ